MACRNYDQQSGEIHSQCRSRKQMTDGLPCSTCDTLSLQYCSKRQVWRQGGLASRCVELIEPRGKQARSSRMLVGSTRGRSVSVASSQNRYLRVGVFFSSLPPLHGFSATGPSVHFATGSRPSLFLCPILAVHAASSKPAHDALAFSTCIYNPGLDLAQPHCNSCAPISHPVLNKRLI